MDNLHEAKIKIALQSLENLAKAVTGNTTVWSRAPSHAVGYSMIFAKLSPENREFVSKRSSKHQIRAFLPAIWNENLLNLVLT
ncbi:hypothetical protein [Ruegeria sp.]|uniref:hypothetical protein n=1 Tax=Ruegeria sp. TaxID=1879320 RepID=UPI003C7B0B36